MAWKLEDGIGTRNKSAVFDERLRTYDDNQSLTNHLSVESGNITNLDILNGEVIGTFTVRNSQSTSMANGSQRPAVTISNNDPINLMMIDRAYVQVSNSNITLPDFNFIVSISNTIGNSTTNIINDNKNSNIIPIVTARGTGTVAASPISNIEMIRTFPTLGNIEELIPQSSDGIIIGGTPTTTINTRSVNTCSISFFNNTGGNVTFGFEAFIRFMMVNPGNSG